VSKVRISRHRESLISLQADQPFRSIVITRFGIMSGRFGDRDHPFRAS